MHDSGSERGGDRVADFVDTDCGTVVMWLVMAAFCWGCGATGCGWRTMAWVILGGGCVVCRDGIKALAGWRCEPRTDYMAALSFKKRREKAVKGFESLWDFATHIECRVDRLVGQCSVLMRDQREEVRRECNEFRKQLRKLDKCLRPGSKVQLVEQG